MTYTLTEDLRVADENGDPLSPRAIVDTLNRSLDSEDHVLVIELIDALMALHDSGAIPVDLKPETRLGIKSLRAKIRAAL